MVQSHVKSALISLGVSWALSGIALADPIRLSNHTEYLQIIRSYLGGFLFVGHGNKGQFKDIPNTLTLVDRLVTDYDKVYGKGKWLAVFGGDKFDPKKPNISHVLKHLHDRHGVPVLAVHSDIVIQMGGVDAYIDYVYYIPTVTKPVRDNSGAQVTEQGAPKTKTHWAGLINGFPKGATEFYLGDELLLGENPWLKGIVAAGGGPIGLEEARYGYSNGVPLYYIRSKAKYTKVNGPYGSIDSWISDLLANESKDQCPHSLSPRKLFIVK